MHPHHLSGPLRLRRERRDRDGRSVARKDRARRRQTIEIAEDLELDLGILRRRLDHDLGVLSRIERWARANAPQCFCSLLRAPGSLFHLALDVPFDRLHRAGERILGNVD